MLNYKPIYVKLNNKMREDIKFLESQNIVFIKKDIDQQEDSTTKQCHQNFTFSEL